MEPGENEGIWGIVGPKKNREKNGMRGMPDPLRNMGVHLNVIKYIAMFLGK